MNEIFSNRHWPQSLFALLLAALMLPGLVLVVAGAAEPDASMPDSQLDDSRFQMRRDGDDIIRLDRKTGSLSRCHIRGESIVCRIAADERTALEQEIASLQAQIDEIKADGKGRSHNGFKSEKKTDEVIDQELDQVMNYSTRILRRFFMVMKDLRKELDGEQNR